MTFALLICIVVLLSVLGAVWGLAYFLVRHNRLLGRRMDLLEQKVKNSLAIHATPRSSTNGGAVGLPTYLPSFHFLDLNGDLVGLDAFVGQKLLLIHWNPRCRFCELIAPELARLGPDLARQGVAIVFVCHEDPEVNSRLVLMYRLQGRLLFPRDGAQVSALFRGRGTPAAYLLKEDGRLSYPLTVGADTVLQLARKAAFGSGPRNGLIGKRSLQHSRIERSGLKPGLIAPSFSLPNVFGGAITLEEYRGRRAVLIFIDPGCGPCNELVPEFKRLNQKRGNDAPAIILIGRGDPAENRRKLEEHGLALPLVVQRSWEISRRYGIFAIPVAFTIDENGLIADKVAQGPLEIIKVIRGEEGRTATVASRR